MWDQTGVVFHVLAAPFECGRPGLTAAGESRDETDRIHHEVVGVLDEEARGAARSAPLQAGRGRAACVVTSAPSGASRPGDQAVVGVARSRQAAPGERGVGRPRPPGAWGLTPS